LDLEFADMKQEDIIRMAREADIDWHRHWNDDESNRLKAFAALVAAAEREECAKLVENYDDHDWGMLMQDECAEAIRARNNVTSKE
jgi:hypothetical protein